MYESRVAQNFGRIEPLARNLERNGRIIASSSELLKHIGTMLLSEQRMVGRVEISEKPDTLWDHPDLEGLYQNLHLIERERPVPMPTDPGRAYASMGNYLFNPRVLLKLPEQANRRGDTDFGRHILPRLPHSHRVFAYDFASNKVSGVQPYEERGYWRDIGTVDAYQAAQRDVLGPLPRFNLVNAKWPIRGDGHRVRRRMVPPAAMAPTGTRYFAVGASPNAPISE